MQLVVIWGVLAQDSSEREVTAIDFYDAGEFSLVVLHYRRIVLMEYSFQFLECRFQLSSPEVVLAIALLQVGDGFRNG